MITLTCVVTDRISTLTPRIYAVACRVRSNLRNYSKDSEYFSSLRYEVLVWGIFQRIQPWHPVSFVIFTELEHKTLSNNHRTFLHGRRGETHSQPRHSQNTDVWFVQGTLFLTAKIELLISLSERPVLVAIFNFPPYDCTYQCYHHDLFIFEFSFLGFPLNSDDTKWEQGGFRQSNMGWSSNRQSLWRKVNASLSLFVLVSTLYKPISSLSKLS